MLRSKTLRFGLLLILAAVFTIPGCDTLVTEVNNNTVIDSTIGQSCLAGCHSDNNNRITVPKGQWENSAHASPKFIEAHVNLNGTEYVTNDANCGVACHTSEGFIEYVEDSTFGAQATTSPIGCYTCHMPHTGNYGTWRLDSLRGQRELVLLKGGQGYNFGKSNMCVHCHQAVNETPSATEDITLTGTWGPHFSPQADVVLGVGGYRFGTEVADVISHSGSSNKDNCIGCHYGSSGGIGSGYDFGEHTFRLEDSLGTQFGEACNVAGCHNGLSDFYDFASIRDIDSLASVIKTSLWERNILDTSDPTGVSFYSDSSLRAPYIPILYNHLLYTQDGSRGVHNPALMKSLLTATASRLDSLPPYADFRLADPADTLACDTTFITFINTSLGNDLTYTWTLDNISVPATTTDANRIYSVPGTYTIIMIATDLNDNTDTITKEDFIVVDGTPTAAFTTSEVILCETTDVVFSDQSVYARSWLWDFGDDATDTVRNPIHTYDTFGVYTVSLAIEGVCSNNNLIKTDLIYFRDPDSSAEASFTMSVDTTTWGSSVTFTNSSPVADFWYWDFGDGNLDSTNLSPTHVYDSTSATVDTFEISLTVEYGCTDSTVVDTIVVKPNP